MRMEISSTIFKNELFNAYVHLAVITAPESGNLPILAGIKILKLNFVV